MRHTRRERKTFTSPRNANVDLVVTSIHDSQLLVTPFSYFFPIILLFPLLLVPLFSAPRSSKLQNVLLFLIVTMTKRNGRAGTSRGALEQGKISRDRLEHAFGTDLMGALRAYNSVPASERLARLDMLCGTDTDPGELQV